MSPALVSCSLDRASIEPQGTTLIVPLSLGTAPAISPGGDGGSHYARRTYRQYLGLAARSA